VNQINNEPRKALMSQAWAIHAPECSRARMLKDPISVQAVPTYSAWGSVAAVFPDGRSVNVSIPSCCWSKFRTKEMAVVSWRD